MNRFIYFLTAVLFIVSTVYAQESPKSIREKTRNMVKHEGFFNFYWDEKEGKIWLEIDRWNEEFLYVNSLPRGVGSNDIGLDRGQLGGKRVVKFAQHGHKVLLIEPNYSYRATTQNKAEQKAVEESFAFSVIAGFDAAYNENGKVLVDATAFLLSDIHDVAHTLQQTNQGNFSLDLSRSAFFLPNTKNFPLNTEVEVILTFAGSNPGSYVRQVVPSPKSITVHQRHSFIKLPDDNYKPRLFDPRAGYFYINYYDYAAPLGQSIDKKFITRHRLEKKYPNDELSEPVEPIIYYVDNGAPKEIRDALIEGASWWNEAFEAAGFLNAFRVEILPEDADPMDVRYNVIQWVHRSTRGWSYGDSVIDPRTGEIIKGHVTLGSLRVRQDFMIAQGLLSPFNDEKYSTGDLSEMALSRIKQLSAHEVGHTLGLAHNYAASNFGKASVMDYPYPYVTLNKNNEIDLSNAYDNNIGDWDKAAITYGYKIFPEGSDEKIELNNIIDASIRKGMIFISDQDARSESGAHSTAHLWDNGSNAVDELNRIIKIRETALNNFGENSIRPGEAYSNLEDVLVPIYLFHRYQVEAASKLIGGAFYTYALRGDKQTVIEIVDPTNQNKALDALLNTITPEFLALPEKLLNIIPPKIFSDYRSRENFKGKTGVVFDPITTAEASANITIELLFNHERCARVIQYNALNNDFPSLDFIIKKIIDASWNTKSNNEYKNEINRAVSNLVLQSLFKLESNKSAMNRVRAVANKYISEIEKLIQTKLKQESNENQKTFYEYELKQISDYRNNPEKYNYYSPPSLPDGAPIGTGDCFMDYSR